MNEPLDPAVIVVICNGPWRVEPMAIRIARASGRLLATDTDRALATMLVISFPDDANVDEVTALLATPVVAHWWAGLADTSTQPQPQPQANRPPGALAHLTDVATLAAVLDVLPDELLHLARWHRPDADAGPERAQHYRYHVRPTRGGGVRVIEAPKERLKEVQRRVLRRVLHAVPTHPAAHGTTVGRGVSPPSATTPHRTSSSLSTSRGSSRR